MTLLEIGAFFAIAFIAAAINSVAGGGTFLTFPVFILNGISPLSANIMSTIALWPGTIASVYGYRSELTLDKKHLYSFLVTGLIGGVCGACLLLVTPELTFTRLVPWLMLAATLIFTLGKRGIALLRLYFPNHKPRPALGLLLQLMIGVYGGYFGAGMGILTLAMLQIIGFTHIHQMNALKTVLTGAINAVTFIIFALSGKVIWPLAVVMIPAAMLGGYLGARLSLKFSPEKVRLLVSLIAFGMTAYFFLK